MYGNSLPGYDAWLERPYQQMCEESDRFIDWCEENDVDPEDDDATALYEQAQQDAAEELAERRAEDMAERMMDAAYDMEY